MANEPVRGGLKPRVVPDVGEAPRPQEALYYSCHVYVDEWRCPAVLEEEYRVGDILADSRYFSMCGRVDRKHSFPMCSVAGEPDHRGGPAPPKAQWLEKFFQISLTCFCQAFPTRESFEEFTVKAANGSSGGPLQ